MPDPEAQIQNQIRNIETSTGRSMDDWVALVHASGFTKHGQIVSWLKTEHGMSHGFAHRVARFTSTIQMKSARKRHANPAVRTT